MIVLHVSWKIYFMSETVVICYNVKVVWCEVDIYYYNTLDWMAYCYILYLYRVECTTPCALYI